MRDFSVPDVTFELNRLASFHEKPPLNEDKMNGYIEYLSKYRNSDVLQAIRDARKEFDRFPTLPQLIGLIQSAPVTEYKEKYPINCEKCGNHGLISVWKIWSRDEFGDWTPSSNSPIWAVPYSEPIAKPHPESSQSVARCDCPYGRRHSGLTIFSGPVIHPGKGSIVKPFNLKEEIAAMSKEKILPECLPEIEETECPW